MSGLAQRLLTAAIGIPLLLMVLYWGRFPFYLLILAVLLVALHEYRELWCLRKVVFDPIIFLAGALIATFAWMGQSDYTINLVYLALVSSLAYHGFRGSWRKEGTFEAIALMAMGLIYIAWPLSLLISIREASFAVILLLLAFGFGSDTAAYFVGSRFGRRRLAPLISPKKSWEGAIGALVFTGVVGIVWSIFFSRSLSITEGFFLGVVASFLGQVGDLFESMLKRFCGAKDSGRLLPGHGGILDRIDSLLLIIPFLHYVVFYII